MERRESTTSLTLLGKLRDSPDDAYTWQEFVDRYGVVIEGWLTSWGLQRADALDVTQNVLLALSRQMKSFEYDPSGRFRSWLRTVAYRAWCEFLRQNRRKLELYGDGELIDSLTSDKAQAAFLEVMKEECTRELLEAAARRVQARVTPANWRAFEMLTYEGKKAEDVEAELGMNVGAIYVARGRIRKMMTEEMERIESDVAESAKSRRSD